MESHGWRLGGIFPPVGVADGGDFLIPSRLLAFWGWRERIGAGYQVVVSVGMGFRSWQGGNVIFRGRGAAVFRPIGQWFADRDAGLPGSWAGSGRFSGIEFP